MDVKELPPYYDTLTIANTVCSYHQTRVDNIEHFHRFNLE